MDSFSNTCSLCGKDDERFNNLFLHYEVSSCNLSYIFFFPEVWHYLVPSRYTW